MKTKIFSTEEEMLTFAAHFAQVIIDGAIIFLHGELGAGKTTFVRGFLRGLGYVGKVKSPTYTLVEPYEINGKHIFHFDLYRLQHARELENIGIEEYFSISNTCLIEWPEKGFPLLPEPDLSCYIEFIEGGRELRIESHSERGEHIIQRCGESNEK